MGTLLALIEAERELVRDLRTRCVIARAFQDEIDQRAHGRVLVFANTTIQQMVSDHRHGLVARLAGWVRTATGEGGFFAALVAGDLSELQSRVKPGKVERSDAFRTLFPGVVPGAVLAPSDLDPIRDQLSSAAAAVLANAVLLQRHFDHATELLPVSLAEVDRVIGVAERLLNGLAVCAGGAAFGSSDHLADLDPTGTARDLVDLELIGTIDRLVSATGANDRLGASGMWWWQYREDFWKALDRAAEAAPTKPLNSLAVVRVASARSRPLTTPQIERLVARYRLEYARYEATARSVEDRLRKMLDAGRVKALVASRAKDPKSLSKKLERKQSKYEFAHLEADLGSVVTDLAGVRVILYDDQDADRVAQLVKDAWKGCIEEIHDARYKARHLTVVITERELRSIDGARCEIQITSLAAHAFNELEHDIGYKDQDVPAGPEVEHKLDVLEDHTATLQCVIRELLTARRVELSAAKIEISTGLDLGTILDGVFAARITGDLDALFYLWQGVEGRLTQPVVERQAPALLEHGRTLAAPNADDATAIAVALFAASRSEVRDIARDYPDHDSALIRAILDRPTRR